MALSNSDIQLLNSYEEDWNKFAIEVLNVRLDDSQKEILSALQTEKRVSVRSGTARGKDFVAAVAALCFLYLNYPSKVICTAPTGRQVFDIMMSEISKVYRNANIKLGGRLLNNKIKFDETEEWFLNAFKSDEKVPEVWSGYHSPNIMVLITEASGIGDTMFDAIEGILQNNSRFGIFFNPNRLTGEAYKSTTSARYKKFNLNDLDAPNVVNWLRMKRCEITLAEYNKLKIPGQVDGDWVHDKVTAMGWCREISKEEVQEEFYDFEWLGRFYRPGDLFRIKVLGQFPEEDESTLVPMPWIEAAVERWKQWVKINKAPLGRKKIGTDIAGDGRDSTIHLERHDFIVWKIHEFGQQKHMAAAGFILSIKKPNDYVMIDTIGEGAGVYSRLEELKVPNIISYKNSHGAKGLHDFTGQLSFANMRAFTFWAIRDWLNPQFGSNAMIPDDANLIEELNSIRYEYGSDGKIVIELKKLIIERLGRSPDKADALAQTFAPIRISKGSLGKGSLGIF